MGGKWVHQDIMLAHSPFLIACDMKIYQENHRINISHNWKIYHIYVLGLVMEEMFEFSF